MESRRRRSGDWWRGTIRSLTDISPLRPAAIGSARDPGKAPSDEPSHAAPPCGGLSQAAGSVGRAGDAELARHARHSLARGPDARRNHASASQRRGPDGTIGGSTIRSCRLKFLDLIHVPSGRHAFARRLAGADSCPSSRPTAWLPPRPASGRSACAGDFGSRPPQPVSDGPPGIAAITVGDRDRGGDPDVSDRPPSRVAGPCARSRILSDPQGRRAASAVAGEVGATGRSRRDRQHGT